MIFQDAARRLEAGETPGAVAERLIDEGLSAQVAYEIVSVVGGDPPDVVPPNAFPQDTATRPTGQEIFDAKTKAEQDEMLGPETAEAVRTGEVELADLVDRSPQVLGDDYITQKPAQDL